jgi:hypothetical protein
VERVMGIEPTLVHRRHLPDQSLARRDDSACD